MYVFDDNLEAINLFSSIKATYQIKKKLKFDFISYDTANGRLFVNQSLGSLNKRLLVSL